VEADERIFRYLMQANTWTVADAVGKPQPVKVEPP
jgi:hypothetical protein